MDPQREQVSPVKGRGAISRITGWVTGTLVGTGWLVAAGGALAIWAEESGRAEDWLRSRLQARLGDAPGAVELQGLELSWTTRTVHLAKLGYRDAMDEVMLRDLRLLLGWSPTRGLFVESAATSGGDLRLSRSLIHAVESVLGDEPSEDQGISLDLLPDLLIEDLQVSLETPQWGDFPLGVLSAGFCASAEGHRQLRGTMVPGFGQGAGENRLHVNGEFDQDEVLQFQIHADGLTLRSQLLPDSSPFEAIKAMRASSDARLLIEGSYALGEDVLPTLELAVELQNGRLYLPWLSDLDDEPVQEIEVGVGASFRPRASLSFWDVDAWHASATASAAFRELAAELGAIFGRDAPEDPLAEAWAHIPELTFEEQLLDLLGREPWAQDLWEMLRPAGTSEFFAAVRLPGGWTPTESAQIERALVFKLTGEGSCAYVGNPNESQGGIRNLGFPLRVTNLEGLVTHVERPGFELPSRLSLIGLEGRNGSSPVRVVGSSHVLPDSLNAHLDGSKDPPHRLDLRISARGLPIDSELQIAFEGLSGVESCRDIWSNYNPVGGKIGFDLLLYRETGQPDLALDLDLRFEGAQASWRDVAVPFEECTGQLRVRSDGMGDDSRGMVAAEATARNDLIRGGIHLAGRSEHGPDGQAVAYWRALAKELDLASAQTHELLGQGRPEVMGALEDSGLSGWADVDLTYASSEGDGSSDLLLEAYTGHQGLRARPTRFPLETQDIRARAIVQLADLDGPEIEASLELDASGTWSSEAGDVPVWFAARIPSEGGALVSIAGAGLDVESPSLRRVFASAVDGLGEDDLAKIEIAGEFDFFAEFSLTDDENSDKPTQVFVLTPHLERLGSHGALLLTDVEGVVVHEDSSWRGRTINAVLGDTPIVLEDTVLDLTNNQVQLRARLTAHGLPIDREHLRFFVDPRTLETLMEELKCSGLIDIHGADLLASPGPSGQLRVQFAGDLSVYDTSLVLGVPIEIHSAPRARIGLNYNGERLRAQAKVEHLSGRVADRRLRHASMQVSYIDPRLTIEAFEGQFEGGTLRSLALEESRSSGFFALDLQPPYDFSLASEMQDVDVGQLLRGVFNSDFANEGGLDMQLRIEGAMGELTGITGNGLVHLSNSGLWSVPVFQALFSQLGFDTAAVFSDFDARFTVAQGRFDLDQFRLKSDLLSLVGEGTIDMDGSLDQDLEVRYSLLDRLGYLNRLLYEIQNSLLRISVRGDLARPEVIVRGLFSGFFKAGGSNMRLPVPAFGPLPVRF